MANYKDKKKLIDDNPDVYVSDYDKNLDYSYLSDIIDQKKAYSAAEKIGDTEGMKKANERANNIRIQAGSYTAGADGSKYNRVKRPYEEESYSQPDNNYYSDERRRLYGKLDTYPEFSYNPEEDPVYNAYKEIYLSLGDDAYRRALGEESLRTGGITNTSAMSAASLARNKYNSMLASKVPELYKNAYEKYNAGKESIYDQLEALWKMEDIDYGKYRDDVQDYKDNRQYYYEKDEDIDSDMQEIYRDENEMEYQTSKDEQENQRYNDKLEFEKQVQADDIALNSRELESEKMTEKYNVAVKIAKVLYGDNPITAEQFNSILNMIE